MRAGQIIILLVIFSAILFYFFYGSVGSINENEIESEDIELASELSPEEMLIEAQGVVLVRSNCTGCHSERLITQNRATREGWESMIRWMQKTQNLTDLGTNESTILDYLAQNYAPIRKGRRLALEIEWYELVE
jgi:hypothetical protein